MSISSNPFFSNSTQNGNPFTTNIKHGQKINTLSFGDTVQYTKSTDEWSEHVNEENKRSCGCMGQKIMHVWMERLSARMKGWQLCRQNAGQDAPKGQGTRKSHKPTRKKHSVDGSAGMEKSI